jgi:hypothetical protein
MTEYWVNAIQAGRRFALVNVWKNVDPTHEPVQCMPLGLLRPVYNTNDHQKAAFPDVAPCLEESRWYIFPKMRTDEILFFSQYDRDVRMPSDVWHCAFNVPSRPDPSFASLRTSFDIRCLVLFADDEDDITGIVPDKYDRFRPSRTKAQLTQSESAKFCARQANRNL